MFRAKVFITLKKSVMDPQGETIKNAVSTLGYEGIQNVRMGKFLEVDVAQSDEPKAKKAVDEICSRLLANPVIEQYHFDLEKVS